MSRYVISNGNPRVVPVLGHILTSHDLLHILATTVVSPRPGRGAFNPGASGRAALWA